MEYKIPDLNKIKTLSAAVQANWDTNSNRFSQTIRPTRDFGSGLPIQEGDSAVYHCLNGGDVFLALATRLDCDWIASDIRPSSVEHTRKKVENSQFRLEDLADHVYADEYHRSYSSEKAQAAKTAAVDQFRSLVQEEIQILENRRVKYTARDSNYFGLPDKSVDWHFTYEPRCIWEPTVLIDMLASAKKGTIFSFSKRNVPSADSLRTPEDGDFSVFYQIAKIYDADIQIFHTNEKALDEDDQEVGYAIISSNSNLPVIDRAVINYCADYVFPSQEIPGRGTIEYEVKQLPIGPFTIDIADASRKLGIGSDAVLGSLKRINNMMEIKYVDSAYSIATHQ